MTVSSTNTTVTYAGTGADTSFGFTYSVPAGTPAEIAQGLRVSITNAAGISAVITFGNAVGQYQIVANPLGGVNPTPTGGQVLYTGTSGPLPIGSTITIERALPDVQATSLMNQGTLWQPVIEQALDYLTMLSQQITNVVSRAVHGPATDPPGINYELPSVAERANQTLIFDANGNVGAGSITSGAIVSAAMAPVVSAATLPAARTAMGLGTIATQNTGPGLLNRADAVIANFALVSDPAGSVSVTAAFHLTQRVTNNLNTQYFFPVSSTLWNGFGFWLFSQLQTVLTPNPADSIGGAPAGQTVTVPADSHVWISTDSVGAWYISATIPVAIPGGYLTLSTDTTLPMKSIIDTPNIWYRPDRNNYVPIYTGSMFIPQQFNDNLQLQLDVANHPAGQIYDVFAFTSGTIGLVTGPRWRQPGCAVTGATNATPIAITTGVPHTLFTGDLVVVSGVEGNADANGRWVITVTGANTFTLDGSVGVGPYAASTGIVSSRGNGAGTTALQRIAGVYVNTVAIIGHNFGLAFNIPPGQATYLGSIYTDQNAAVTCRVAAGNIRIWGVWNAYNRKAIRVIETDNTATYNYNTFAWQVTRNDFNNTIIIVVGLPEEIIEFTYEQRSTFQTNAGGTGGGGKAGILVTGPGSGGLVPSGFVDDKAAWITSVQLGGTQNFHARYVTRPIMGFVQAYPLQSANATALGTVSWYGGENNMLFGARWNG